MPTEGGDDTADVSVCIPAYEAAAFIDRTLDCARRQTHARLRILVSVDASEDATEAICRRHAADDPRIEVVAQPRRLGWSENANHVLARVRTPFCFLYFHDDIIAPEYVARLREALLQRPDAASAHCDLERFGKQEGIDPGNAYEGPAARRLLAFMVGPVKGTPLRSLLRCAAFRQPLRFPRIGEAGFWRCHPFLLQLLSAGPALHVPGAMYRRWFRDGGLTAGWGVKSTRPLREGQHESTRLCLEWIERAARGEDESSLLRHALYIFVMTWTRRDELRLRAEPMSPAQVHPALAAAARAPACLAQADPVLRAWFATSAATLAELETRCATVPG